ncbi:MAG TPA: cupin domain-containing protein [Acidisphaera sp.]|nr:cupin domain-containing protein [Acidisphaera sp.]
MPPPRPRTIPDLTALESTARHERARRALVHQTDDIQISHYTIDPGGRVPRHRHSVSWDIAVVLEGAIDIRMECDGETTQVRCGEQAVNIVPPGMPHEIANAGDTVARVLLIQSPSKGFDFVRAEGA